MVEEKKSKYACNKCGYKGLTKSVRPKITCAWCGATVVRKELLGKK